MAQTLFEKIWNSHVVNQEAGKPAIIYIDLHLVHEVTSPQAFEGLRLNGRTVRRPEQTILTVDHNIPTWSRSIPVTDPNSLPRFARPAPMSSVSSVGKGPAPTRVEYALTMPST